MSPPPVAKDVFSYAGDVLFAEASGHNRHRRATLPELQALFHPASTASTSVRKDPVGHWYEAQLLHYGLAPSKNKAVAKTRLLDAVNKGTLVVPAHVQRLEAELKKEWMKREREVKAELKRKEKEKENDAGMTKGTKRKAGSDGGGGRGGGGMGNVYVTVNIGGNVETTTTPAAKKGKSMPVSAGNVDMPKSDKPKNTARRGRAAVELKKVGKASAADGPKHTAKRGGASASLHKQNDVTRFPAARPKQTARRGSSSARARGGPPAPRGDVSPASSPQRPKQTARSSRGRGTFRGGAAYLARTRDGPNRNWTSENSASETDDAEHSYDYGSHDNDPPPAYSNIFPDADASPPSRAHGRLGLLNGRYELSCPDLDEWEQYSDHPFTLTLTLSGNSLWGAYDFGMFSGILYVPERPWEASDTTFEFTWRGREHGEGEMSFDDNQQKGWVRFLGEGEIEGMISVYGEARFRGTRVSGAETRSERNAASMRAEWDGYNEDAYGWERVGRW